jgi:hypothetical protein
MLRRGGVRRPVTLAAASEDVGADEAADATFAGDDDGPTSRLRALRGHRGGVPRHGCYFVHATSRVIEPQPSASPYRWRRWLGGLPRGTASSCRDPIVVTGQAREKPNEGIDLAVLSRPA